MAIRLFDLSGSVSLNITAFTQAMQQLKSTMREAGKDAEKLQKDYDEIEQAIEKSAAARLATEEKINKQIIDAREKTARRIRVIEDSIDVKKRSQILARTNESFYQSAFDTYRNPKIRELQNLQNIVNQGEGFNQRRVDKLNKLVADGLDKIIEKKTSVIEKQLESVRNSLDGKMAAESDRLRGIDLAIEKSELALGRWQASKLRAIRRVEELTDPTHKAHRESYDRYRTLLLKAKDGIEDKLESAQSESERAGLILQHATLIKKLDQSYEKWSIAQTGKLKDRLVSLNEQYALQLKSQQDALAQQKSAATTARNSPSKVALRSQKALQEKMDLLTSQRAGAITEAEAEFDALKAELAREIAKPNLQNIRTRMRVLSSQTTKTLADFSRSKIDAAIREIEQLDISDAKKVERKNDLTKAFGRLQAELNAKLAEEVQRIDGTVAAMRQQQQELVTRLPSYSLERLTLNKSILTNKLQGLESRYNLATSQFAAQQTQLTDTATASIQKLTSSQKKIENSLSVEAAKRTTKLDTLKSQIDAQKLKDDYFIYLSKRNQMISEAERKIAALVSTNGDPDELRRLQKNLERYKGRTLSLTDYADKQIERVTNQIDAFNKLPAESAKSSRLNTKLVALREQTGAIENTLASSIESMRVALQNTQNSIEKSARATERQLRDNERKLRFAERTGGIDPMAYGSSMMQSGAMGVGVSVGLLSGIGLAARPGAEDQRDIINALNNTSIGEQAALQKNLRGFSDIRKEVTNLIIDMARSTGRPVKELADSFREVENVVGYNAKGVDAWKTSVKGAMASGADLLSTTKTVAGLVHLFPEEFKNASEALNMMSTAARKSPLELNSFAQSLGQISGAAKISGATATETMAAMQVLTTEQLKSADAATQLRNVFLRIPNPTRAVKKELEDLGKAAKMPELVKAFSPEGVKKYGSVGVLSMLKEAIQKANADEGTITQRIFRNMRGVIGGGVLLDKLIEYQKAIEDLSKSKEADSFLNAAYESSINSVGTAMDRASIETRVLSGELATALLPTFQQANGVLRNFVSFVKAVPPETQKFALQLGITGVALAGLASSGKVVLGFLTFLSGAVDKIGMAFAAFRAGTLTLAGSGGLLGMLGLAELNPIVLGITALVAVLGGGAIAYNYFANSANRSRESLVSHLGEVARTRDAQFEHASAVEGLVKRYTELAKANDGTAKSAAEMAKIRSQILNTTGVEISQTSNLEKVILQLAKAFGIAADQKNRLLRNSYDDFILSSPDNQAYIKATEKVKLLSIERRKFESAVVPSDYRDALGKTKAEHLKEMDQKIQEALKDAAAAQKKWDAAKDAAFAQFKAGQLVGSSATSGSKAPYDPDEANRKEDEKARLAKDLLRQKVSQQMSEANQLYSTYKNSKEKIYRMMHPEMGDEQARARFDKLFIESDPIYKLWKQAEKAGAEGRLDSASKVITRLTNENISLGVKIDQLKKAEDANKEKLKEKEREENRKQSLLSQLANLVNGFGDDDPLGQKQDSYVRKLNDFMNKDDVKYGKIIDFLKKSTSGKLQIEMSYYLAKELDKKVKVAQAINGFFKAMAETIETRDFANDKLRKLLNPATDAEVLLNEYSKGKYDSFSQIKNADELIFFKEVVAKAQEATQIAEKAKNTTKVLEDLPTRIAKARGELRQIGASDYITFLNSLGTSPEEISKDDFLGVKTKMAQELFAIETRVKRAKEVFDRLKREQRARNGATDNPIVDAIDRALDEDKRYNDNLDKVRTGFESSVAAGIRGGIKSGLKSFVEQIQNELVNVASRQIAKVVFDQVKGSGVFEKLFNYKGLSPEVEGAVNNPEAFALAMAQQVLNVNVLNMPVGANGGLGFADIPSAIRNAAGQSASGQPFDLGSSTNILPGYDSSMIPGSSSAPTRSNSRIGLGEGLGYAAALKRGGLSGTSYGLSGIAKFFGAKGVSAILSKLSVYAFANELLGDPVGKGLKWAGSQLFGSKKKRTEEGWGRPDASRSQSTSQSVVVNMPGAQIHQPSDAEYLGTEIGRVFRSSPNMVNG